MSSRVVTKSLGGQEDLLFGESLVTQKRAGGNFSITGIRLVYPVNSEDELNSLDAAKFPKVRLYNDGAYIDYYWTGTEYAPCAIDANNIDFSTVPTSDPLVAGKVWNDAGTLRVSGS